jgi:hypothetical protein
MKIGCAAVVLFVSGVASAAPAQLQIDGGLSVIGVGYEHPLAEHVSVQAETFVFGTYFLPWFDLGEDLKGVGAGVRATYFARPDGRGLYITPYVRGVVVDKTLTGFGGLGVTTGAFVGWDWALGERLDLRVGGGAQYIHCHVDDPAGDTRFSTAFVAIDATLGYRL